MGNVVWRGDANTCTNSMHIFGGPDQCYVTRNIHHVNLQWHTHSIIMHFHSVYSYINIRNMLLYGAHMQTAAAR